MSAELREKSRRLACTNSKWNVHFVHVIHGVNEVPDYLVVEPKVRIAHDITGVAILPVLNGSIGLLRIHRIAVAQAMWEAPRGFVDSGEESQNAALRELEEETGLVCDPAQVVALGSVVPEASTLAARINLYAALQCRTGGTSLDDEMGLNAVEFFSFEQAQSMAESSLIEDAATLTAIFRLVLRAQSEPNVRRAFEQRA